MDWTHFITAVDRARLEKFKIYVVKILEIDNVSLVRLTF